MSKPVYLKNIARFLSALAASAAVGALAAPDPNFVPPLDPPSKPAAPAAPEAQEPFRLDREGLTEPAPPPEGTFRKPEPTVSDAPQDRYALVLRAGAFYDSQSDQQGDGSQILFGALFAFPAGQGSYEIGGNLLTTSASDLVFGRRFVWSHRRIQPFVKLGIGLLMNPGDGIGAFSHPENLQLRASYGADLTLVAGHRLRLEIEGAFSGETAQAIAAIGYVFAWR